MREVTETVRGHCGEWGVSASGMATYRPTDLLPFYVNP